MPIVKLLISQTKDFDPDVTDGLGWTPLMMACSRPNSDGADIASLLISKDASVNAKTTNLQTPLHFAVSKLNLPIVQLLLEHKASARLRDKRGQLAIHRAAASGSVPLVKWLIKAGSPVNSQDVDGLTPLHHATSEGHGDAALYLIVEGGADTSKRDGEGKLAVDLTPDGKVREFIMDGARRAGVEVETDVKNTVVEEEE
jgi:26S proteasome non-ATPase regulatory subunit 10